MGSQEGVLHLLAECVSRGNTIKGIFIVINHKEGNVTLFGNTSEILGLDDCVVTLDFNECTELIDNEYYTALNHYIRYKALGSSSLEFKIINKLNQEKWLLIQGNVNNDEFGVSNFEGYLRDITLEKSTEILMNDKSLIDCKTGLHNRSYLQNTIDKYFDGNIQDKSALIILDIDNFNYINDSFGYKCGDIFLQKISNELKEIVNENETVCRIGGDEFVIFLPNVTSLKDAEIVARKIIKIFNKSYTVDQNQIYATTSVGIAVYPNDGRDFNRLLKSADAAMYIAKSNGKNQYQFFNSNISKELDKIYSIQRGLLEALEKEEMYVVFQPKVTLHDDEVSGFEALIRWKNKELGDVNPGEFISIAETTGQIIPIGKFVLREVFNKARYLLDHGYGKFKIAYNLSEVQLRDNEIIEVFKELSKEFNVSGQYIEIEITESMLMKSFNRNNKYLLELKEMGASIALDDFGTGYSSLNYLTKLPIDVLKIDRSFVVDILNNNKNRWIVENIIELSHKLGIEVVAEGVEHKEQVDVLKEALCDTVQGYYYSKPELFEKAMELLVR